MQQRAIDFYHRAQSCWTCHWSWDLPWMSSLIGADKSSFQASESNHDVWNVFHCYSFLCQPSFFCSPPIVKSLGIRRFYNFTLLCCITMFYCSWFNSLRVSCDAFYAAKVLEAVLPFQIWTQTRISQQSPLFLPLCSGASPNRRVWVKQLETEVLAIYERRPPCLCIKFVLNRKLMIG